MNYRCSLRLLHVLVVSIRSSSLLEPPLAYVQHMQSLLPHVVAPLINTGDCLSVVTGHVWGPNVCGDPPLYWQWLTTIVKYASAMKLWEEVRMRVLQHPGTIMLSNPASAAGHCVGLVTPGPMPGCMWSAMPLLRMCPNE